MNKQLIFQRRYILPSEHGSWIWWIGPYCIGIAAAGQFSPQLVTLFVAMLAAFLVRQPVTVYVKTLSNRRSQRERLPALIWTTAYAAIALAAFSMLLFAGFGRLIGLLIPGIPVFIWHLHLVSQRAERGQRGIEIVGAGVLALAAPASYWVAEGSSDSLAWALWAISWLQSAASIVLVYQRLQERSLDVDGLMRERLRRAARALAYHTFNVTLASLAHVLIGIPRLVIFAFVLMLIDAMDAIRSPARGWRPTWIGLRQLFASSLFMLLVVLGFLI